MKVVFAAGGTAGHINPAVAIAKEIKKHEPDSEIIFIGRKDGMEAKLVTQNGFSFKHMEIHGFERKMNLEGIFFNIYVIWCIFTSTIKTGIFFRKFRPDIVIGCGGYISGPVVRKAAVMKIPTVIQEQNSFPGVTTKLLAKKVNRIFAPNEDAAKRIGFPEKTIIAGNPVKPEIRQMDREKSRMELGIGDRVCIVSSGGSLGSETINAVAANILELLKGRDDVFLIHSTGTCSKDAFDKIIEENNTDLSSVPCRVTEFINDMPRCLAAADLVIGRSGAITLAEIEESGRASYLIPSPMVAENHQYFNAMTLADCGAAVVEEEKNINYKETACKVIELASDKERLEAMGKAAKTLAKYDTAAIIYENVKEILK